MKTGWIFVKAKEINIEEIKGSNIDLGMLGRFLGYGKISLDARFVKDAEVPFINKPYRFARAMNDAQAKLEDHVSLIIDDSKNTYLHLRPETQVKDEDVPMKGVVKAAPPEKEAPPVVVEENPSVAVAEEPQAQQFEDKPMISTEQIEKALAGDVITIVPDAKAPPQKQKPAPQVKAVPAIDPDNRPQSEAHPVAEGSYEEEKLKEELIEEWTEHSEDDEDDPYAYRSPRQLH
jgi:hypothetical protein